MHYGGRLRTAARRGSPWCPSPRRNLHALCIKRQSKSPCGGGVGGCGEWCLCRVASSVPAVAVRADWLLASAELWLFLLGEEPQARGAARVRGARRVCFLTWPAFWHLRACCGRCILGAAGDVAHGLVIAANVLCNALEGVACGLLLDVGSTPVCHARAVPDTWQRLHKCFPACSAAITLQLGVYSRVCAIDW